MPSIRTVLTLACGVLVYSALADVWAQTIEGPEVLPPPGSQIAKPARESLPEFLTVPPELDSAAECLPADSDLLGPLSTVAIPETYEWYQAAYWFGPAPWDAGVQFGLNGSEGINSTQSLQVGGHLKRDATLWKYDSNLSYNRNSSNGLETQNNALLDARLDRKLDGSRWSLFMLNQTQYDEYQPYDLRVALNSGLGYRLIDTEIVDLASSFGAGASREFGGPDDRWAPEALFGLNYEHLISKTQRFTAKVDYFPEWGDFNAYRVVSDAGWEIDLDRPSNVSLKFSVNDRYDSTPNGVDPNLVNYSVLLIWGL
mgnify:CR=1 FL=1